jgi:hypothetical protein
VRHQAEERLRRESGGGRGVDLGEKEREVRREKLEREGSEKERARRRMEKSERERTPVERRRRERERTEEEKKTMGTGTTVERRRRREGALCLAADVPRRQSAGEGAGRRVHDVAVASFVL